MDLALKLDFRFKAYEPRKVYHNVSDVRKVSGRNDSAKVGCVFNAVEVVRQERWIVQRIDAENY